MTKGLLTLGAVVEVLADGTLVAMAHDRVHSTAITSHVAVHNLRLLGLFWELLEVACFFHKLVENSGDRLLELSLNEVSDGLSLHFTSAALAFLSFLTLLSLSLVLL